jgi:hypothetical protein
MPNPDGISWQLIAIAAAIHSYTAVISVDFSQIRQNKNICMICSICWLAFAAKRAESHIDAIAGEYSNALTMRHSRSCIPRYFALGEEK